MMIILSTQAHTANPALGNTIVTLVSFIILMLIIRKYAWGALMNILIQRETQIKDELAKAANELEESEQANREAQVALREARAEATQIILQAKKQSLQVQDTMLKEAKEEVDQMRAAAQKDIELERRRMLNEIKAELTDISIEIAEKILRREIKSEDYHRLIDDFIQEMDDL